MFGWGINAYGQLGLSAISFSPNLPHPQLLPMPDSIESLEDQITDIRCGKRHTIILCKSGKLFSAGNVKEEKSTRLQQIKDLQDLQPEVEENKKSNKNKKKKPGLIHVRQDKREENKMVNDYENSCKHRWIELT